MKAVANASGVYFKNVDSDDWVDADAVRALLEKLRYFIGLGEHVDLVITNYVYEHVEDDTRNVVDYRHVLPVDKVFTWNNIGHFMMWQYLLMHALTYRVDVLREAKLEMPAHTFYVDNIYAYVRSPSAAASTTSTRTSTATSSAARTSPSTTRSSRAAWTTTGASRAS